MEYLEKTMKLCFDIIKLKSFFHAQIDNHTANQDIKFMGLSAAQI